MSQSLLPRNRRVQTYFLAHTCSWAWLTHTLLANNSALLAPPPLLLRGMSDNGITSVEAAKAEADYLTGAGGNKPPFPHGPTKASESANRIIKCTQSVEEPFQPDFKWANPWLQKKDNKGKKERGGPPQRAAVQLV